MILMLIAAVGSFIGWLAPSSTGNTAHLAGNHGFSVFSIYHFGHCHRQYLGHRSPANLIAICLTAHQVFTWWNTWCLPWPCRSSKMNPISKKSAKCMAIVLTTLKNYYFQSFSSDSDNHEALTSAPLSWKSLVSACQIGSSCCRLREPEPWLMTAIWIAFRYEALDCGLSCILLILTILSLPSSGCLSTASTIAWVNHQKQQLKTQPLSFGTAIKIWIQESDSIKTENNILLSSYFILGSLPLKFKLFPKVDEKDKLTMVWAKTLGCQSSPLQSRPICHSGYIYEGSGATGDNGKIEPALAESWDIWVHETKVPSSWKAKFSVTTLTLMQRMSNAISILSFQKKIRKPYLVLTLLTGRKFSSEL